jgi:hypothetical protein
VLVSSYVTASARLAASRPTSNFTLSPPRSQRPRPDTWYKAFISHGLRSLAMTLWLFFDVGPRSQTAAKVVSSAHCYLSQLKSRTAPVRSTPVPLVKMPVLSSQPLNRSVEIFRKRLTVSLGPSFDAPGVPEQGNSSQSK